MPTKGAPNVKVIRGVPFGPWLGTSGEAALSHEKKSVYDRSSAESGTNASAGWDIAFTSHLGPKYFVLDDDQLVGLARIQNPEYLHATDLYAVRPN